MNVIDELLEVELSPSSQLKTLTTSDSKCFLTSAFRSFSNVLNSVIVLGDGGAQHLPEPGEGGVVALHLLAHVHQEPGDGLVVVGGQALHLGGELVDQPSLTHERISSMSCR